MPSTHRHRVQHQSMSERVMNTHTWQEMCSCGAIRLAIRRLGETPTFGEWSGGIHAHTRPPVNRVMETTPPTRDSMKAFQRYSFSRSGHLDLACVGLGIAGEAGEVADLVKKHLYHGHDLDKVRLKKELGDVLWYVAMAAQLAGFTLADVAETNVVKNRERYPNGFNEADSRNRKPD